MASASAASWRNIEQQLKLEESLDMALTNIVNMTMKMMVGSERAVRIDCYST